MAESMSCIFSTGRLWKLYKTRSFHFDIATAARTRWYSKGVLSGPVFGGGLKGISFVISLASASSPSPSRSWTHTHR
ncbi:hypothetical protein MRB53_023860 [Persea americana]|uniref:Uncharacterized protein n=1 Tax=Persea americana TaxID=3435 RepID=A0ACC2LAI8_PERAE|nr:hypothetical protein MRB53_023860 [Persea americana]